MTFLGIKVPSIQVDARVAIQPVFLAVRGGQEASFNHEVNVDHSMMSRLSLWTSVASRFARAQFSGHGIGIVGW